MLDDLLKILRAGTASSEARQETNEATAAAYQPPAPVGAPSGFGGGGRRKGGGGGLGITAGGDLGAFLKAISTQESGGNYQAKGVQTSSGRAYGKYQILDSNFVGAGGWDKETLGRDITLQQYMRNPKIQEQMAQGKLTQYYKRYGAAGAAKSWYAGEGNHDTNSNSSQYGGPSINAYAQSVLNHMRKYQ